MKRGNAAAMAGHMHGDHVESWAGRRRKKKRRKRKNKKNKKKGVD
jgi:membrane protein DedA with SNARE-associated domain